MGTWYNCHPVSRLYHDDWNFCGCGNPKDLVKYIRKVLTAYSELKSNASQTDWNTAREKIEEALGGLNQEATLFMLYWLASKDYTEHGGSVYGAWLSDLGRSVLALLNKHGDDDWDNCETNRLAEVDYKPKLDEFLREA